MLILLIVYVSATLVTWMYSGFASGRELSEVKDKMDRAGAPPQYIQINYTNVFFQGFCWPVYWMVFAGMWYYKKFMPKPEATQQPVKANFGGPTQQPRGGRG